MVYFLDVTPNYNVEDNNIWVFAVGFPACLVSACSRLSEALWLGCASSVMRGLPELVRGTQYFVCQAEESPENQLKLWVLGACVLGGSTQDVFPPSSTILRFQNHPGDTLFGDWRHVVQVLACMQEALHLHSTVM